MARPRPSNRSWHLYATSGARLRPRLNSAPSESVEVRGSVLERRAGNEGTRSFHSARIRPSPWWKCFCNASRCYQQREGPSRSLLRALWNVAKVRWRHYCSGYLSWRGAGVWAPSWPRRSAAWACTHAICRWSGTRCAAANISSYVILIHCRANIRCALFAVMLTDFLCSIFIKQKICGFLSFNSANFLKLCWM